MPSWQKQKEVSAKGLLGESRDIKAEEVNVGGKWGPTPGGKETVKEEGLGSIPWVVFALKKANKLK